MNIQIRNILQLLNFELDILWLMFNILNYKFLENFMIISDVTFEKYAERQQKRHNTTTTTDLLYII